MKTYDVIILGGGASGLFAAACTVKRGFSVAIIDMGDKPARKVAVSGGGRCNFTNMAASPERYFGKNKNFVRGALARFSPNDMITWMHNHKLKFVEKAPGQYFCADGAAAVATPAKTARAAVIAAKDIAEKAADVAVAATVIDDWTIDEVRLIDH